MVNVRGSEERKPGSWYAGPGLLQGRDAAPLKGRDPQRLCPCGRHEKNRLHAPALEVALHLGDLLEAARLRIEDRHLADDAATAVQVAVIVHLLHGVAVLFVDDEAGLLGAVPRDSEGS